MNSLFNYIKTIRETLYDLYLEMRLVKIYFPRSLNLDYRIGIVIIYAIYKSDFPYLIIEENLTNIEFLHFLSLGFAFHSNKFVETNLLKSIEFIEKNYIGKISVENKLENFKDKKENLKSIDIIYMLPKKKSLFLIGGSGKRGLLCGIQIFVYSFKEVKTSSES